MHFETVRFGTIEVTEDQIINFPAGIPGFPDISKYILLDLKAYQPFTFLQSLEEPNLTFILVNPYNYFSGYPEPLELIKACITDEVSSRAQDNSHSSILVKTIVTIRQEEVTVNLIAPLVINSLNKTGEQVILNGYPGLQTNHPLKSGAQQEEAK